MIEKEEIGPLTMVTQITKRDIQVKGLFVPDFDPEVQAALGATLSRDPGSIESRLAKIFNSPETKKRIMDIFFKKYGHNSIGDMGFFALSIEGISMKGAVNVVENRLFNGQEASTRYIDFREMGFLPVSKEVDKYSEQCMYMYKKIKASVVKDLMKQGVSKKEAEPQAFDVAGAFLPISARTNVFWVGNIRTYITQIRRLMSGDAESREIGRGMSDVFNEICPNSMKDVGEDFYKKQIDFGETVIQHSTSKKTGILDWNSFNLKSFLPLDKKDFEICDELGLFGSITASFNFDFRSARDIHRHRAFLVNKVQNYQAIGIESFYLDAISDCKLRLCVNKMFNSSLLSKLSNITNGEYGMPMATKFSYIMSGDLSAWLYFLKLRSGPKVHPTVISLTQEIGREFEKTLGLQDVYHRGGADYFKRSSDLNNIAG